MSVFDLFISVMFRNPVLAMNKGSGCYIIGITRVNVFPKAHRHEVEAIRTQSILWHANYI